MKKIIPFILGAIFLGGCSYWQKTKDVVNQGANTAVKTYDDTKNAVNEKVEEVNTAVDSVGKAVDSVNKATTDVNKALGTD